MDVFRQLPYNALPVDVASGSCPEVGLWDITLLAKSYCCTCPRSRFLGSFTDHFDGLPTNRQTGFVNTAPSARIYRHMSASGGRYTSTWITSEWCVTRPVCDFPIPVVSDACLQQLPRSRVFQTELGREGTRCRLVPQGVRDSVTRRL